MLATVFLIALTGCKKTDATADQNSEGLDQASLRSASHLEIDGCNITQVVHEPSPGLPETMAIAYNAHGDPATITQVEGAHTGSPHYIFTYDKKHRLIELLAPYDNGSYETYHKYFYANPGQKEIILDSSYSFPEFTGGVLTSWYQSSASHLTYDHQKRVIKDSTIVNGSFVTVRTFVYGPDGNIVGPSYDTKVNFHRTNKVWMFIDRDYSLNNKFVADTYNTNNLPTSVNLTLGSGSFMKFMSVFILDADISYDCP